MIKKITYALVFAGIALVSCNKQPQPMSREQMRLKTDSIVSAQARFSEQEARKDLERRIKIEVRVKADSMLNVRLHPAKQRNAPNPLAAQPNSIFPKQR